MMSRPEFDELIADMIDGEHDMDSIIEDTRRLEANARLHDTALADKFQAVTNDFIALKKYLNETYRNQS